MRKIYVTIIFYFSALILDFKALSIEFWPSWPCQYHGKRK